MLLFRIGNNIDNQFIVRSGASNLKMFCFSPFYVTVN